MGAQCRQVCVCVYCMWASVALWLEVDRLLCLFNLIRGCHPLGSAHSGFQEGNSIYCLHDTHTSSPETRKHPFICGDIWGDFKACSRYVIVAYLECCVLKGFFFSYHFFFLLWWQYEKQLFITRYILMNGYYHYYYYFREREVEVISECRKEGERRLLSHFASPHLRIFIVCVSREVVALMTRHWPICLTSICLLCYYNHPDAAGHEVLSP